VAEDLKTVSAALAYDDPVSGETVILLVHQAIYIPAITHNLLSSMQVRLNDVIVNDTPRFLTDTVTDHTHSIVIPVDNDVAAYVIPLSLQGVTSSFPTRKPTIEEFESLPHLCLTNADVPYDPADPTFAQQEHSLAQEMLQTGGRIGAAPPSRRLCSVSKTLSIARMVGTGQDRVARSLNDISPTFDDGAFLADDTMVATYELKGGWMHLGRARIGKRAFLGNSGMAGAGHRVPRDGLVAVLSVAPEKSKPGCSSPKRSSSMRSRNAPRRRSGSPP
jgi:hypothetical protein